MKKQGMAVLFGLFLFMLLSDNAAVTRHAFAVTPQATQTSDPALEKQRTKKLTLQLLEAAGKRVEILRAQLDGDEQKVEKSVSELIAIYDVILTENPSNIKAINGRASARELLAEGSGEPDYRKALNLMTLAVAENNQDARAYFNRAVAYRGLKMYPEARADYQKAIALDPNQLHWGTELKAMEAMAK